MAKPLLMLACLAACAAPASAADSSARKKMELLEQQAQDELGGRLPGKTDDEMALTVSGAEARLRTSLEMVSGGVQADLHAIMLQFHKFAQEASSSARKLRHAEMRARMDAAAAKADQSRAAAEQRLKAGAAAASAQAAAGAMSVTGAGIAAKSSLSDPAARLEKARVRKETRRAPAP
jgi:hypothetical protein